MVKSYKNISTYASESLQSKGQYITKCLDFGIDDSFCMLVTFLSSLDPNTYAQQSTSYKYICIVEH